MFDPSAIARRLRAASGWLLVALVALSVSGLGAAPVAAAGAPCGLSCPCEDEGAADLAHADGAPDEGSSSEDCADDCSSCGCWAAAAHALLLAPGLAFAPVTASHRAPVYADAPALGARTGVFRPPRALG